MAYPTSDASSGNTGHITDHNNIAHDLQRMQGRNTTGVSYSHTVPLDSFAGATDDLKLAAAMSYAGAQSNPPHILLGADTYTFSTPLTQPYNGFSLWGGNRGWSSPQGAYVTQVTNNVSSGTPAAWITLTGDAYNYHIEGIAWNSTNNNTQWMRATSGNTMWSSTFRHLAFKGYKGVMGNSGEAFATDLITINGQWTVLTCYDTAFNIKGGDDRALWAEGMNIGSGDNVGGGSNKYLMMFSSNSKATVGPIYLTADNGWRGIQFSGSQASGYGIVCTGMVVEGRNPGDPCDGNLIRIIGGAVTLRDLQVNSGMASPLGTEHGLIEVTGTDTQCVIDGLSVGGHTTGLATTTPVVYISGTAGNVWARVSNATRGLRSGSPAWGTQLPVVRQTVTGLALDTDTSVDLRTGP